MFADDEPVMREFEGMPYGLIYCRKVSELFTIGLYTDNRM
jgi:hypothetical protein